MHNIHWLFISNVLAHWISFMSSIVSFTLGIIEYVRNRKTEGWIFGVVACLFLLVSFDQAWQDEHRNSQALTAEKSAAIEERNFWNDQSYQKDGSLRSRDQLLAQNYAALIVEQTTANNTQASLSQLSAKILDFNKPEMQKYSYRRTDWDPKDRGSKHLAQILVMTNKPTAANIRIRCQSSFSVDNAFMIGGGMNVGDTVKRLGPNDWLVRIPQPQVTPDYPLLVMILYDADSLGGCSFDDEG
jgi:hypothetical protein